MRAVNFEQHGDVPQEGEVAVQEEAAGSEGRPPDTPVSLDLHAERQDVIIEQDCYTRWYEGLINADYGQGTNSSPKATAEARRVA